MAAFSNYLTQTLLKLVFGATAYTAPTTLTIGLSFTTVNSDGTGILEPTGGAYARQAITNNGTNWAAPAVDGGGGYHVQNATPINFPTATANWVNGSYTSLTDFFIVDGSANLIAFGKLSVAKTVTNGDTASFAANALSIVLQ